MLPFIDSEDDIYINLSIVLIIIKSLGKTSRGILKINNEKLHIFLYLIKNPTVLNILLRMSGKSTVFLNDYDSYSVASISPNFEPLFNGGDLKALLSILIAKKMVTVIYKKNSAFFYVLSGSGSSAEALLQDEYLKEVRLMCDKLKSVLSISDSQLNQSLSQIIKKGISVNVE